MSFIWGSMRATASPETATPGALATFLGRCADMGCSQIDLADIYGNGHSEALVGEALSSSAELRDRFSLIAKSAVVFASEGNGATAHHYRNDARHLEDSLSTSLRRLRTEAVDIFLVHRPDYLLKFDELATALERMVQSGKVRQVGVSNFPYQRLKTLGSHLSLPIAHHQLEFSVLETSCLDNGLLDDAQSAKRAVSAWSPLGGGRFFDPGFAPADRVRTVLEQIADDGSEDGIAGAALAWVGHHPSAPVPILGGTQIERMERQVAKMTATRFDNESWYAVLEASRNQPVP